MLVVWSGRGIGKYALDGESEDHSRWAVWMGCFACRMPEREELASESGLQAVEVLKRVEIPMGEATGARRRVRYCFIGGRRHVGRRFRSEI